MNDEDVRDGWRLRLLALGHLPALAFHAACRHDLFSLLEQGPALPSVLAGRAGLDPDAVELLLEALTALELTAVEQGVYRNLPIASRFLVRGRPLCQLDIVAHQEVTQRTLERSEQSLKEGHLGAPAIPPGHLDAMMASMQDSAQLTVHRILEAVPPGSGERLLDLGGGAGSYTLGYLAARPDLVAVYVDLPPVAEAARPLLGDRVEVRPGDMREVELGSDYSLILLSNVLHYLQEEDLDPLFARCARALAPEGRVVVHDALRGNQGNGPLYQSLLALRLLTTAPGRGHTVGRVQSALRQAGLESTARDFSPEPSTLIVASRS